MARFTVRGQVEAFVPHQRNIRVQNWRELKQFWSEQKIDTRLDWAGDGPPLVTVSAKAFVENCQPGDEVEYVIETWDRADGRRIRGMALTVVKRS